MLLLLYPPRIITCRMLPKTFSLAPSPLKNFPFIFHLSLKATLQFMLCMIVVPLHLTNTFDIHFINAIFKYDHIFCFNWSVVRLHIDQTLTFSEGEYRLMHCHFWRAGKFVLRDFINSFIANVNQKPRILNF